MGFHILSILVEGYFHDYASMISEILRHGRHVKSGLARKSPCCLCTEMRSLQRLPLDHDMLDAPFRHNTGAIKVPPALFSTRTNGTLQDL